MTPPEWPIATAGFLGFIAYIAPPEEAQTLQELYDIGNDVRLLIDALLEQKPTRDSLADLIRGGNAHVLVGQPEGNWLDVKSQE
jgi:hypothetical protein